MTLVMCFAEFIGTEYESAATAHVCTSKKWVDEFWAEQCEVDGTAILFFTLPRVTVLAPNVCPIDLTVESWKDDE